MPHSMRSPSRTGFLVAAVLLQLSAANRVTVGSSPTYDAFRRVHRQGEGISSKAYAERLAIFEASQAEVAAHNALKKPWTMGINQFADFTKTEKHAMLGYKRVSAHSRWGTAQSSAASALLQQDDKEVGNIDVSVLAKTVDWRKLMNFSNYVHNQGGCGSCWAHAATSAVEAYSELATGNAQKLSVQQVIDCTANPRQCGGSGGCHGSTAEEAYEHMRAYGIVQEDQYTKASDGTGCGSTGQFPSAVQVTGFVRLPENSAVHLLHALATKGPVALSIDAGGFFNYKTGVLTECTENTVVNHAVLGVGYGTDPATNLNYYLIKNSWGPKWGEQGYLRVKRFDTDSDFCGVDSKPEEGVACSKVKHPDHITVCGMCGVTSDSTYPIVKVPVATQMAAAVPVVGQKVASDPQQEALTSAQVGKVKLFSASKAALEDEE